MTRQKTYCVRIVQIFDEHLIREWIPDQFIEAMRIAGLVSIHETEPYKDDNGIHRHKIVFDIESPMIGPESYDWSQRLAATLKRTGYNAVTAPSTR